MTKTASSFVLAAAVTVVFNTALACVKDAYAPLLGFMNSLLGHNWTTQGVADLLLFLGLGLVFMRTGLAEKVDASRLKSILIWSVAIASFGLFFWYSFT